MYIKKKSKAQAAMEYLMTYGWAILIILIALGALFYLGIFRPKTSNACIGAPPITCTDIKIESDGTLTLVAGAVGVDTATLDSITLTSPVQTDIDLTAEGITLGSSPAQEEVAIPDLGLNPEGKKFAGSAKVTYMLEGSALPHTSTVQFSGTIEAAVV